MSAWLLPAAAGGFWAGLLAWPVVGRYLAVGWWLALGTVAAAEAIALAPRPGPRDDPLERAGVLEPSVPGPADALTPAPTTAIGSAAAAFVLLTVATILLGIGWGGFHEHRTQGALLARIAPARVELTGDLRTDPSPTRFGWSAAMDVRRVRTADAVSWVRETVWLEGDEDPPHAVRGDRLQVAGSVIVPDDPGFASFLLRRGMAAEVRATSFLRLGASSNPVVRAAQWFRRFVGRSIRGLFPAREAGLLMGLALGDDAHLDPAVTREFQATGLSHLLVVSGENVAMVLAPVMGLAMLLRLSPVPRFVLGVGTVVFFVVLTGAEPSVMRAGVMAVLALTGILLGRPRSTGTILAGAVLALVVMDPSLVWGIGFQLSVAATATMVLLASSFAERIRFLPRPAALAAGATLAAQFGVTPILLFHFHEVPLVTIIANVLAFPAVSPALVVGLLAGAVGLVSTAAGHVLAGVALVPLRYLEILSARLARAPVPWITSRGGIWVLVVGLAIVALGAWWLRARRRVPKAAVLAGAFLLPLFVWGSALSAGPPSGLVVHFFDVGQGDAALVSSPAGANVLIDGGPEPDVVATKLSALGIKRLDLVVATHPHLDHFVGLPAVLSRFPVGVVLDSGCDPPESRSPEYRLFLEAVHDEGVPERHPRRGDVFVVGDLRLEVLSPDRCWQGTHSDPNNDSIVLMVSLGDDRVLFANEPEADAQQMMLDDHEPLEADVLNVPHHGAATSLPEFFVAVHPAIAVVSVGPNTYGHPVPEVLDEIAATGAQVLRTDREGDITVEFDRRGLLVESAGDPIAA